MKNTTGSKKIPFWRNIKVVPYLYILPNMILFITFMIIPIFMTFYYGTVKWNGLGTPKFIGLENYLYIFKDKVFLKSIFNTFYYAIATVPLLMVLALFFAVLLNNHIPLRGLIRSAVYAPAVVSTVVVGTVFTWIFQDQLGLINYILTSLGGTAIKWNNDPRFAMLMLIVATVWQKNRLQYGHLFGWSSGNSNRAFGSSNYRWSKYVAEISIYHHSTFEKYSYVCNDYLYD